MKKHYLDNPNDTKKENSTSSPDRSSLASLYPSARKVAKTPILSRKLTEELLNKEQARQIDRLFIKFGLFIPAPFIIGGLLVRFYVQSIDSSNILFFLPIIAVSVMIWITSLVILYVKAAKYFDSLGLNLFPFLSIHLSCLVLVTPFLYGLSVSIRDNFWRLVLFSSSILVLSILLAWAFTRLSTGDKISNLVKLMSVTAIVLISLSVAIFYLISQL